MLRHVVDYILEARDLLRLFRFQGERAIGPGFIRNSEFFVEGENLDFEAA